MISKEIKWKKIDGFNNYSISNFGNVRNDKTNKILKPYITKKKYIYINIMNNNGEYYNLRVHRLVAKAFIPNPLNKPCVNHLDYNPSNNFVDNLDWVTYSENCIYSSKNISIAHKGKRKNKEHKISISKSLITNENHHIYKNGNGWLFRFRLNGIDVNKTFKIKEEAIEYRDNYFKEIDYVIK